MMGLRLVALLLLLSNNVLAINYLRHRFKEAMEAKSGTPKTQCKVTGVAAKSKDLNGYADVDLYYRSIVSLLAHHVTLRDAQVKPEHIIPGSGSGAFFYGCSHPHMEKTAVLVNDIDGICMADQCNDAFEAAYKKQAGANELGQQQAANHVTGAGQAERHGKEFQNTGQFYVWPLDRMDDGLMLDMEVFDAAKEKFKTGDFEKTKRHHWKRGMLQMYDPVKGVKPTALATTKDFCTAKPDKATNKIAQYACPLCRYDAGKTECTDKDSDGNGLLTGNFDVTSPTWCKDNCEGKKAAVSVPDCASVCLFKRVMLNGKEEQRKKEGGLAKLKQDLADLKCLMKGCKLDKLCKPTQDEAKMKLTNLKGVGFGPKDDSTDDFTDNDPPASDALANDVKKPAVNTVDCKSLKGTDAPPDVVLAQA